MGKGSSETTGKAALRFVDGGRNNAEDVVWFESVNVGENGIAVDRAKSVLIGVGRQDAIRKKRINNIAVSHP